MLQCRMEFESMQCSNFSENAQHRLHTDARAQIFLLLILTKFICFLSDLFSHYMIQSSKLCDKLLHVHNFDFAGVFSPFSLNYFVYVRHMLLDLPNLLEFLKTKKSFSKHESRFKLTAPTFPQTVQMSFSSLVVGRFS